MEKIPIPMYNVCIMDVDYCIKGRMYNGGRILIDRDTFNFAGHLTDDVLIGTYENGTFEICYYYHELNMIDYTTFNCTELPMKVKFQISDVEALKKKCFRSHKIHLYFKSLECKDKKEIQRIVDLNRDLIKLEI